MARPPRLQIAGGVYHVMARGVARQAIFRDDLDRRHFLELVDDVVARHDWACQAYVLLTTHYHLLVRTPSPDLARRKQRLNACYAFAQEPVENRRLAVEQLRGHRRSTTVAVLPR
jgi:putative transposase